MSQEGCRRRSRGDGRRFREKNEGGPDHILSLTAAEELLDALWLLDRAVLLVASVEPSARRLGDHLALLRLLLPLSVSVVVRRALVVGGRDAAVGRRVRVAGRGQGLLLTDVGLTAVPPSFTSSKGQHSRTKSTPRISNERREGGGGWGGNSRRSRNAADDGLGRTVDLTGLARLSNLVGSSSALGRARVPCDASCCIPTNTKRKVSAWPGRTSRKPHCPRCEERTRWRRTAL